MENRKSTNKDITDSLRQMGEGNRNNASQLKFDNTTGEFYIEDPDAPDDPNSVTITEIAKDGFAAPGSGRIN